MSHTLLVVHQCIFLSLLLIFTAVPAFSQDEPKRLSEEIQEMEEFLEADINAPIIKIMIEPKLIDEFRITPSGMVYLKLAVPQEGIEVLAWKARSLSEAEEFVNLLRKDRINAANVKNGAIVSIVLNEKNLP